MNQPRTFTEADFVALSSLFSGGDISACTKVELERFAVMLSRPKAFTQFPAPSFPQLCETVRTLLLVRMSEEQNEQAKRESRLALIIASVALTAGIVQAVVSLGQWLSNVPIQVQASTPLLIRTDASLPVYMAPASAPKRLAAQAPDTQRPTPSAPQSPAASIGASK